MRPEDFHGLLQKLIDRQVGYGPVANVFPQDALKLYPPKRWDRPFGIDLAQVLDRRRPFSLKEVEGEDIGIDDNHSRPCRLASAMNALVRDRAP